MSINHEQTAGKVAPGDLIKTYYSHGYKVLVLDDKNPFNPYRSDRKYWQREHVQQEDVLSHHAGGGNVGLQMGEVSGWLSAADLDVEEAERLAPQFLPRTLTIGKGEGLPSVYVYRSEGCGYLQLQDVGGGELIALKASADGKGHQIKVPPSVHPKKGRYEWRPAFDVDAITDIGAETLTEDVRRLAVASLIRRYLPAKNRHDYSKAIAGALLRRGYDADDLAEIMAIVWTDAKAPADGVRNASKNVHDTARGLQDDKRVTGGTKLNEMVPNLAGALVKAAGLERNQAFGSEWGEDGETADDSDLARLWLYKRKGVVHSPHGWLKYAAGWWQRVDEGLITQDILRLMDRAPGRVSANRLKSVVALAQHHSYVKGDVWDANRDIIVCTNGTLDLKTFKLREHRAEDRALGGLPFDYDPDATAETWNASIGSRLQPGEWEFLQEFTGYALTTDCSHELAVWLVGEGGTGKSTFVEGVQKIVGPERAAGLSLTDLERSPFALENVVGRTLLTATEQPSGFIRYVDILNRIISGEEIPINRKNRPIVDVRSTAKILWAMNRTPQIREEGSGFFRRIHPVTFPALEGAKDPTVKRRIVELEGPGILAWAVEGLRRLRERGSFDVPASVRDAMVEYEYNNNPAAQFIAEMCEKGENFSTPVGRLYALYAAWCRENGYKAKAKNTVAEDWTNLKVGKGRTKNGRFWRVRVDEESDAYKRLPMHIRYE